MSRNTTGGKGEKGIPGRGTHISKGPETWQFRTKGRGREQSCEAEPQ